MTHAQRRERPPPRHREEAQKFAAVDAPPNDDLKILPDRDNADVPALLVPPLRNPLSVRTRQETIHCRLNSFNFICANMEPSLDVCGSALSSLLRKSELLGAIARMIELTRISGGQCPFFANKNSPLVFVTTKIPLKIRKKLPHVSEIFRPVPSFSTISGLRQLKSGILFAFPSLDLELFCASEQVDRGSAPRLA
eukprot:3192863-Rhodomonas_salina.3